MKMYACLIAILLCGCAKEIESNEEADQEIPRLIAEYREAVAHNDEDEADELHNKLHRLIIDWGDHRTTCSENAFRRDAQYKLLNAIPMEVFLETRGTKDMSKGERVLSHYYNQFYDGRATAEALEKSLDNCKVAHNYQYTPTMLAAIRADYKRVQEIDRRAKAFFPATMWRERDDRRASDLAQYQYRTSGKVTTSATKEVADCVAAATTDPQAAAQVKPDEIVAACRVALQ